jgi:outer membrane protein assembly factor BamA
MRPATVLAVVALLAVAAPAWSQSQQVETLAEVRVHGNYSTPDAEVLRIAGLTIGQPLTTADIEAARKRLEASGRFEEIEIRKRSRSLEDSSDLALIVIVREHPVPDAVMQETPAPLRPFRRLWASGLFLPVLNYTDGYGFTYGARFTFVDVLGRGSRLSTPLTWGGTRRAAAETEWAISRGPIDRLAASASIWQRTNPFYERDEDRRELTLGMSRAIARALRVGVHGAYGNVAFADLDERLGSYGASITLDTRQDPVFPRNAVFADVRWTALDPSISRHANTYLFDARGYRAFLGQSVVSVRGQYGAADAPLPPYARWLLGGASTVRGYRAGTDSGDSFAALSVELRVPLTSPLGISHAGYSVFADFGRAWDYGARFSGARWRRGVGGGLFFLASVFQLNLDVAVREGGGVRAHFGTGLQF